MDDEVAKESRKYGTQTGVDGNEVIQKNQWAEKWPCASFVSVVVFFLTKYISMPSTTKQKRDTLKNCSVFWEKKPLTQIFTFLTIILLLNAELTCHVDKKHF